MYDMFGYLFPNNFKMRQSLIVFRFLVEAQGNFLRLHQLYYKLLVLIIKHSDEYFEIHYCIFSSTSILIFIPWVGIEPTYQKLQVIILPFEREKIYKQMNLPV